MPRETKHAKSERVGQVLDCLSVLYPEGERCLLDHSNAFTLLIAVLLSAQTTDASVNKITPELFRRWPDPSALAAATVGEVEGVIRSIGLYRSKAKNAVLCAQKLLACFGGEVPGTMNELTSLPGVGRKTANIVLNCAFGRAEGIAVDTHVFRIATRLHLTSAPNPLHAERDLLAIIPRGYWSMVNHTWVLFGREFCQARSPRCAACPIGEWCPQINRERGVKPG